MNVVEEIIQKCELGHLKEEYCEIIKRSDPNKIILRKLQLAKFVKDSNIGELGDTFGISISYIYMCIFIIYIYKKILSEEFTPILIPKMEKTRDNTPIILVQSKKEYAIPKPIVSDISKQVIIFSYNIGDDPKEKGESTMNIHLETKLNITEFNSFLSDLTLPKMSKDKIMNEWNYKGEDWKSLNTGTWRYPDYDYFEYYYVYDRSVELYSKEFCPSAKRLKTHNCYTWDNDRAFGTRVHPVMAFSNLDVTLYFKGILGTALFSVDKCIKSSKYFFVCCYEDAYRINVLGEDLFEHDAKGIGIRIMYELYSKNEDGSASGAFRRFMHENINRYDRTKMFFDIDCNKAEELYDDYENISDWAKSLLDNIISVSNEILGNISETVHKEDFIVMESNGEKKASYHIVNTNFYFRTLQDQITFMENFEHHVKEKKIKVFFVGGEFIIDIGIYKRFNTSLRTLHSYKLVEAKKESRILKLSSWSPWPKTDSEIEYDPEKQVPTLRTWLGSLVTNVPKDSHLVTMDKIYENLKLKRKKDSKYFPTTERKMSEGVLREPRETRTYARKRRIYQQQRVDNLELLLKVFSTCDASGFYDYFKMNKWIVTRYEDHYKLRPNPASQKQHESKYCHIKRDYHNTTSTYYVINRNLDMVQYCISDGCRGKNISMGQLTIDLKEYNLLF